ncbi:anthranilate synthase component I family protein [Brevundimonas variabilis]|uniref:Para-aminobenzoate synthetase component 1 n=1 Tax=Brevundimonas variabilis TaxID=74312 RepID=A0A7W9CHD4_9CAUL|nr:anthranilate synthase component I family protein [Brevundimonas variabilis]MBB5745521.1 para-aminobenzoate synthetase component 1 [Brevundimonas variabilis]
MSSPIQVETVHAWVEPRAVACGLRAHPGLVCLLSDGEQKGRQSWIGAGPDRIQVIETDDGAFNALKDSEMHHHVVGLASYDSGARAATGAREPVWPDLMLARYAALLRFDHDRQQVVAIGLGSDAESARVECDRALQWLRMAEEAGTPVAPSEAFVAETSDQTYCDAVADVVARIGAGELFQANIARAWTGTLRPLGDPFDVFLRLARTRGAPYAAFWQIGDRAIVSNSPELFLSWDRALNRIETRPIKGTRGRDPDPQRDRALIDDLVASAKDQAENLMIVDLMRNDLARVCLPGSVTVDALFAVETHPTVHHLVSTVSGTPRPETTPAELLAATFPPGSITGAPKHQAMRVIAQHEAPRGPWCGSLFLLDDAGGLTASVLIRTASFERAGAHWSWRTLAGAGIVADSDPLLELAETEVKIRALREALVGT